MVFVEVILAYCNNFITQNGSYNKIMEKKTHKSAKM